MGQFGIGQAVRRKEDIRFITGAGRYVDDARDKRQAYAAFLRSPHAHARVKRIDIAAAKRAPGVLAVYTADDARAAGLGRIKCVAPLKNRDGSDYFNPGRPLLAEGKVRHVGDPVALVVAGSAEAAKDAVELIEVDYDPLPSVVDPAEAVKPGAPSVWDEAPGNVALDWGLGDPKPVEAAFAKAAKIVRLDLAINRVVVAPLEPRGILADYDAASGRYTLQIGTQGVFGMRSTVAQHLGVPEDKVRVVTGDVVIGRVLVALRVARLAKAGRRDHLLTFRRAEQGYTGGAAAGNPHIVDRAADQGAAVGDKHDLVGRLHRAGCDHHVASLVDVDIYDARATAVGDAVFVGRGALAEAVRRDGENELLRRGEFGAALRG